MLQASTQLSGLTHICDVNKLFILMNKMLLIKSVCKEELWKHGDAILLYSDTASHLKRITN